MSHIQLVCVQCSTAHQADMLTLYCGSCESPLDVAYNDRDLHTMAFGTSRMPVPFHADSPSVTLGEGRTPIVALPAVGEALGGARVFAKLEFMNPTGSFKDRGSSVMLSVALEHGVEAVVEDSSGNAGGSVAAYAARAGIIAHVFAPESAPDAKMGQIRVYNARTHPTPGPREASTDAAVRYQHDNGLVYASHNLSPYFVEGTKTFGYEVVEQMSPGPDHIVIPVGNGSLLLGAWKAYQEMLKNGSVEGLPKLHAVQSEAVMPIAAEFSGLEWRPGATTIAGGISVGAPPRKQQVLRAIRESGGSAVAVPDASTISWQRLLASREGVFAEPTSAAAFAGLELLCQQGAIRRDETSLVAVTGFGLKDVMPELVVS